MLRKQLWNKYCLYNYARYVYLKIENRYNNRIEETGITLPQLRVLWVIKCFPGVSLGEIARIGCWAPPTVTKMLRSLMDKGLVIEEEHENKRSYKLLVTEEGDKYIEINRLGREDNFILFDLSKSLETDEIKKAVQVLENISINDKNNIILSYVERINEKKLKIDYDQFDEHESERLKYIIAFYNLLRTFILSVESAHRQLIAKFDVTYPQLRALWIIEAFPGITSSQLSEISFWSPSTSNIIVKNLYSKELIYKEKSQIKNALYLYISSKGENLILEDFNLNNRNLPILNGIKGCSDEDIRKLNLLLKNVNKIIGNDKVEDYVTRTFKVIETRLFN